MVLWWFFAVVSLRLWRGWCTLVGSFQDVQNLDELQFRFKFKRWTFGFKDDFFSSSNHLKLDGIQIYGDAKVIIDWALNVNNINILHLSAWLKNTRLLIGNFKDISFSHVFKEHNQLADFLSKRALHVEEGYVFNGKWVNGALSLVEKVHIYHS